jgi:hypothetical protein
VSAISPERKTEEQIMKAIQTKYLGATNFKPARIVARAEGVASVTVSYDSEFDEGENHARAAKKLRDKMGWTGRMVGGGLADGNGYAFAFANSRIEVRELCEVQS